MACAFLLLVRLFRYQGQIFSVVAHFDRVDLVDDNSVVFGGGTLRSSSLHFGLLAKFLVSQKDLNKKVKKQLTICFTYQQQEQRG